MLDRFLLAPVRTVLKPAARAMASLGVPADAITLVGFGIGLLALPALATGSFRLALACILVNRLLDGLDGLVARLTAPTDRGAFLDIALDFFFYAVVPFGFALHDPGTNALPAAGLILAFMGTGSSFLAFAVIAAKRDLASDTYPAKGIYYLGGLTEGTETILFFIAICLWPTVFSGLATIFAALCLLTTGFRWYWGWKVFSPPPG
jgi:phosphatidylglycerophosphate synthase